MSNTETKTEVATATSEPEQNLSLLQQAIAATKQTEPDHAKQLVAVLTEQALNGVVTFDLNVTKTIDKAIMAIDKLLSEQITEVLHHKKLQTLEGSWRGLNYLVKNTLCGEDIKIKVFNVDKITLQKNIDKAGEFDQSEMFKKVYEYEYGTPGGFPYGVLIGDYEIGNNPTDISFLQSMSGIAASAFAPFIASAAPSLLGLDKWEDLSKPRDLAKVFESPEYARWRGFRQNDDARFVNLVLPRTLARMPYGANSIPVEGFNYEELALNANGKAIKASGDKFCWMNAAYVKAVRLTEAFAEYGWCTAIRGAEGGGRVNGLPTHTFVSDDGDIDMQCPTEIGITDRREAELSKQGFLPLCHYKNTDFAVFFGGQSTQQPKVFDNPDATANAAISARLPYIMATSRIAHYLKVMARDKIGSFMEKADVEKWLNKWITDYVNSNPDSGQKLKSRFPLADAKIQVKEVAGKPGSYQAIAWLRPWMQMEELTTSLRLVANIPQIG